MALQSCEKPLGNQWPTVKRILKCYAMLRFNSPAKCFAWLFSKSVSCTSSRRVFPQKSMLQITLTSERMNVTWGKKELFAVCTNAAHACRNRQCCPSQEIVGSQEIHRITTVLTRDLCGVPVSLSGAEGTGKEGKQNRKADEEIAVGSHEESRLGAANCRCLSEQ